MSTDLTFRELAGKLCGEKNFLIFPHENPDGDALGSASGLCLALRALGKRAYVLLSETAPAYLSFLDKSCFYVTDKGETENEEAIKSLYSNFFGDGARPCTVLVDSGSPKRIDRRENAYLMGKLRLCIDHHQGFSGEADFSHVEPERASCSELIFDLVHELENLSGSKLFGKDIAEALFSGISTDTGNFQYSQVSSSTFRIAAELVDFGASPSEIGIKIYQSNSLAKVRLHAKVLAGMRLFAGGRAGMAAVSQGLLSETGALSEDSEGIVDSIRGIAGVELAVLAKEQADGSVKFSLRSKNYLDVNELAKGFGGGGHIRAAGCTVKLPLSEAMEAMKERAEQAFDVAK